MRREQQNVGLAVHTHDACVSCSRSHVLYVFRERVVAVGNSKGTFLAKVYPTRLMLVFRLDSAEHESFRWQNRTPSTHQLRSYCNYLPTFLCSKRGSINEERKRRQRARRKTRDMAGREEEGEVSPVAMVFPGTTIHPLFLRGIIVLIL